MTFCTSLILRLSRELKSAQQRDGEQVGRSDGPVHLRGVDHHEDHADHRREQQVHRNGDQLLDVRTDLLKFAQRLAAALVFEQRIRQFERVPDAVGVEPRARPAA